MLTRLFDLYGISSGLLASETTYPQALQQLLAAAQNIGNQAIQLKTFLAKNVSVWGELLIPLNASEKLQSRIAAVHKASDDIRSRFTTPAKLKNFDYDDTRMKTLEDGFAAMHMAERAHIFYTETQEIMHYITTAESKIPTDVALHDAFAEKKRPSWTFAVAFWRTILTPTRPTT